jgi:hypothetical protein
MVITFSAIMVGDRNLYWCVLVTSVAWFQQHYVEVRQRVICFMYIYWSVVQKRIRLATVHSGHVLIRRSRNNVLSWARSTWMAKRSSCARSDELFVWFWWAVVSLLLFTRLHWIHDLPVMNSMQGGLSLEWRALCLSSLSSTGLSNRE